MWIKKDFWLGPLVVLLVFSIHYGIQSKKSAPVIRDESYVPDFSMKEVSSNIGISFTHHVKNPAPQFKNIWKWLTGFGASVAIADINGDGFQDILLNDTSEKNNHGLFINNQHGQFSNQWDSFGLAKIKFPNPISRVLTIDCNKDGFQDLLLISACPQLLVNQGGKRFIDYTSESGIQKCSFQTAAANVFDYDNDGNLDVIWGAYFASDYYSTKTKTNELMPDNFLNSNNKAPLVLMKGDGQCHFTDHSKELPTTNLHGWYFSIGIQDIFEQGRQDIVIAADYGIDHLLKQKKTTNDWTDESQMINHASLSKNGMGVDFADISHERQAHMYMSNIYQKKERVSGNLMWRYNKVENKFDEVGHDLKTFACGWSWGAKFVDFNMDGWDDLVVVNGFVGDGTKTDYWYNLSVLDSAGRKIMANAKNWPDMEKYDLMGGEQDCLFVNRGKLGYFSDAALHTVFDKDKKNGRAVAYIDVNNDGHYHLIVANQNDQAKAYEIIPKNPFNWIGLELIGVKSNISGIGAKINWSLSDGNKSYKELRPHNGFSSQSDPRFHLGFPKSVNLEELSIDWPSGIKQKVDLKIYPLNHYYKIKEDI